MKIKNMKSITLTPDYLPPILQWSLQSIFAVGGGAVSLIIGFILLVIFNSQSVAIGLKPTL